jgi:Ni/Co efflux regulator RcnB
MIRNLALFILAFLLTASTLQAGPPDKKGKSGKAKNEQRSDDDDFDIDIDLSALASAGISRGDARKLASQHGLTGSKPLPPGIRKNMARGKPMPPGIQKTRMSDSFLGQLPRHKGYEWQQAGSDLVLVAAGSMVISDVLEGVFD